MAVTHFPTCQLIVAEDNEFLVVHSVLNESVPIWGAWQADTRGEFRLVLGPLYSYVPLGAGLSRLGIISWTVVRDDLPTPEYLVVDERMERRLGNYDPPRGSRRSVVAPRRDILRSLRVARRRP